MLTFSGAKIVAIEPGPAFNTSEWKRIGEEIEKSILAGPLKVGRDFSFSSFRVPGSWKGERSGLQILPPPDDAPQAPVELAAHPFILEFPMEDMCYMADHKSPTDRPASQADSSSQCPARRSHVTSTTTP